MTKPAPFLSWLADKLGTTRWVVAARLTPRLKEKGYLWAMSPDRYAEHEAEWRALVDQDRAERIALRLFPDDYFDGHDCRGEIDRVGLPCRICADKTETWAARITAVAEALAAEK